ncbi:MAG: exodeoxyribonuclease III [Tenacibaculum sp.]
MKIISYNVNGIRSALKKGFIEWLQQANPDVICIQETRTQENQLNTEIFKNTKFPFQYWFSAQKKGYSGVAIFCKKKPKHIAYGTGIENMDFEGRNLRIDYDGFSIMSLYLPSGTNSNRLQFKFKYMDEFQEYINQLKKKTPNLIICGDYNICHREIDIHNPKMKGVSGFLPEERQWLSKFIESGFTDSFRYMNKELQQYSWWSYRANSRNNNKGWRIDYCMVANNLKNKITKASILTQVKHSDHCPIALDINL